MPNERYKRNNLKIRAFTFVLTSLFEGFPLEKNIFATAKNSKK